MWLQSSFWDLTALLKISFSIPAVLMGTRGDTEAHDPWLSYLLGVLESIGLPGGECNSKNGHCWGNGTGRVIDHAKHEHQLEHERNHHHHHHHHQTPSLSGVLQLV